MTGLNCKGRPLHTAATNRSEPLKMEPNAEAQNKGFKWLMGLWLSGYDWDVEQETGDGGTDVFQFSNILVE